VLASEPARAGVIARLRRGWPERVDPIQATLLLAFCALAAWVPVVDLVRAGSTPLRWTHTIGTYVQDEMQYLAWIRDASRHVLVCDLFVLRPTPHDYLQPLIAISGGLVALGMAPWFALLVWQPLALLAVLAAVLALVRRALPGKGQRRAALALVLFAAAPGSHPDLWLAFWAWGYPFGLISLAGGIAALLICARPQPSARARLGAAALGLLAAWLHPWQGETLIVVLLAGLLLGRRAGSRRPLALERRCAALVIAACALPLLYYVGLDRLDSNWGFGASYSTAVPQAWKLALYLAPLGVPALLAYRRPCASRLELLLRCWPPAAIALLVLFALGLGGTPTHTLLGISVPLGILAVQGVSELPAFGALRGRRALTVALVLAATVPGVQWQMSQAPARIGPSTRNGNFVSISDLRALSYLQRDPRPGGVLTGYDLGLLVPGATGRATYLGDSYWTPDWQWRWQQLFELFGGWMRPRAARAFVRSTGARFILSDCTWHHGLPRSLLALARHVRRFGCAELLELESR
jgi:hypothetical protein